jgi:carbamoyl-phosphate synthase small subunit
MTPAATQRPASFFSPRADDVAAGLLATAGGILLSGRLRAAPVPAAGDLIFTTAATGWGEIATDPSFEGQIVILTHPMAGSYRIDPSELESDRVHVRALVVTRLVTPPAGPGLSLEELLTTADVPILEGIDTRALTLELRRGTARTAVVLPNEPTVELVRAVAAAGRAPAWEAVDHVAAVATSRPYVVGPSVRQARATLIDYGVKRSLLRALADRGLEVTVLPHDASPDDLTARDADLIVLSPGPGDPARMAPQIETVRRLARLAAGGEGPPILGICLGHQLLALATGARTRRLDVGHHGGNHAVVELESGRVDIGAHNHEVEVLDDPALRAAGYRVTHRDLNDGTVEGLRHQSGRIASVQFHPEGAPGPIDAARVLDLAMQTAIA